jgi:hypothetical protein
VRAVGKAGFIAQQKERGTRHLFGLAHAPLLCANRGLRDINAERSQIAHLAPL